MNEENNELRMESVTRCSSEGCLPWQMTWNGRTWKDMPGASVEDQRLNFALFRRGLLEVVEDAETGELVSAASWANTKRVSGLPIDAAARADRQARYLEMVAEVQAHGAAAVMARRRPRVWEKRKADAAQRMAAKEAARAVIVQRCAALRARLKKAVDAGLVMWRLRDDLGEGLTTVHALLLGRREVCSEAVMALVEAALTSFETDAVRRAALCAQKPRKSEERIDGGQVPPNHMTFRAWLEREAWRIGITPEALYCRINRGQVPWPTIWRLNKRCFFVPEKERAGRAV